MVRPRVDRSELDFLDTRLVTILSANARRKNVDIARELGVSESTVRKRIDRLISSDIVRITATTNPFRTGFPVVAVIGIRVIPASITSVGDALDKLTEFRFIGMTTGAYDYVAEAWFGSLEEMRMFLTDRLMPIQGIAEVDASHVLQMIRYAYDWGRSANRPAGAKEL